MCLTLRLDCKFAHDLGPAFEVDCSRSHACSEANGSETSGRLPSFQVFISSVHTISLDIDLIAMSQQPSKKPDPPKKMEARSAGASTNREDVFKNILPDHPDDGKPDDGFPKEEKLTFKEALGDLKNSVKRKSLLFLGIDTKQDEQKNKDGKIAKHDEKKDG